MSRRDGLRISAYFNPAYAAILLRAGHRSGATTEINGALTGQPENEDIITKAKHLCWIYEQESALPYIIEPFIKANLTAQRRCLLAVPESTWDLTVEGLEGAGGDVKKYIDGNQLIVEEPEKFFFTSGRFDIDLIINRLDRALADALAKSWRGLAVVTDASLLLDKAEEVDWAAYEFRVNFESLTRPLVMLCLYDARRLSGSLLTAMIKTHPVVGMGKSLALNPFYADTQIKQLI